MKRNIGDYEIDDTFERVDFATVHRWLADTYWNAGVSREYVERAARHSSLVMGVYRDDRIVGYGRIVSDRTTFAWVSDVYVDPAHRGRGLAKEIVKFALAHPGHQDLRRWLLATRDAHDVYASIGFGPLDKPESMMVHRPVAGWDSTPPPESGR
jgi:GNAT superfamily N-acetyltransferase